MSTTSTRLDPRVLRTRLLIRDAFIELLQEMELEKITVNRIAKQATINRVTFYLHYRDIPDMLEKMADDMTNDISAALGEVPKQSTDRDWSILVKLLEHIAANSNFYKVLLSSKRIPVFSDRLNKLIVDQISNRAENRDISASASTVVIPRDIVIWYGSSACIGTIICWLRNDLPYTPHYLAKQLSLLFRMHQNTDQLIDPE